MASENSPFFSVIIPIYNVSRFIEKGFKNILAQSFKDYEVIMVDDGSTDGSGKMCDQLANADERVFCFHQENMGSGPARDLGIHKSSGEYIAFFDIDDEVDPNWLQVCHDELKEKDCVDVLMFSYDSYDIQYKTITPIVFERLSCSSNKEIQMNYVDHLLGLDKSNGFVWNKVYRREFLIDNQLSFPHLLIQQDEVFNLRVYRKAHNLMICPAILYHYFVYGKGNTRSGYIPDRLRIYRTVKDEFMSLYEDWHLDDIRMPKYVYKRYFNSIVDTITFNNNHDASPLIQSERDDDLRSIINDADVQDCINQMEFLSIVPHSGFMKWYYKAIRASDVSMCLKVRKLDLWYNAFKKYLKGV